MRKIIVTLVSFYYAIGTLLFCQTENENAKKYWNYKDKFKKYFTYIGLEEGNSIPAIAIKIGVGQQIIVGGPNGNIEQLYGSLEFGDAMVDQGLYLAVLATEYKNLSNMKQDLTAIRNEIYFALEAVNRVDDKAESYFDKTKSPSKNGFFIRADVPKDFYEKWERNPIHDKTVSNHTSDFTSGRNPQIELNPNPNDANPNPNGKMKLNGGLPMDKYGNSIIYNDPFYLKNIYRRVSYDYDMYNDGFYGHKSNEMSQDHAIGLVLGLYMVWYFVGEDFVQPPRQTRGFNLKSEAKEICLRILDYVSAYKVLLPQNVINKDKDQPYESLSVPSTNNIEYIKCKWCVSNPTNDKAVARGPFLFNLGFGYPLSIVGNKMDDASEDRYYFSTDLKVKYKNQTKLKPINWPNQITLWNTIDLNIWGHEQFYNKNHMFKLAAMSGTWSQDKLNGLLQKEKENNGIDRDYFELLYTVLNNLTPKRNTRESIKTILDVAPCGGNFSYAAIELFHNDLWRREEAWSFNNDGKFAIFNGLDYMLLYNLYRIQYFSAPTVSENQYDESLTCPCASLTDLDYSNTSLPDGLVKPITSLTNWPNPHQLLIKDFTTVPMFPEYNSIGIPISEYLNHNFSINSKGILEVKEKLTICSKSSPVTLTVNSGGTLSTSNKSGQYSNSIIFRKNTNLTINSGGVLQVKDNNSIGHSSVIIESGANMSLNNGGTLVVEDNCSLIIEAGAKLKFSNGGIIKLKGPNSKLIIRGTVELQSSTTFQITLDPNAYHGQIVIDKWWGNASQGPAFTSTDGKGRLNFEGRYKGEFLLKIIGNNGLVIASSDIEFATFKKCRVNFTNKDAALVLEPKNSVWIEETQFDCFGTNDLMWEGIKIQGSTNRIIKTIIKNARIGIDFNYLKPNGNPSGLGLSNVDFDRCETAVRNNGAFTYDGGTISHYGRVAFQSIGDNWGYSKMNGVKIESIQPIDINGKSIELLSNGRIKNNIIFPTSFFYQGTKITLIKNTFGEYIATWRLYEDYIKAKLINSNSWLQCNTFDKSYSSHIQQSDGTLRLRGNILRNFTGVGEQVYTDNSELYLSIGYNMLDDYANSRQILSGTLNKKQYVTPNSLSPYNAQIDGTQNLFHGIHKPVSNNSYQIYQFPAVNSINDIYIDLTPNYNTASTSYISRNDFLQIRNDFCDSKLYTNNINPSTGISIAYSKGSAKRSDNPGAMWETFPEPGDTIINDTTVHLFFKVDNFTKLDKLETIRFSASSIVPVSTATLGVMSLGVFYDSVLNQVYGNPYSNIRVWIRNITEVLKSDTLPTDTMTNMYRDELLEDLTFAIGRGIDSRQFFVSPANTVTLDSIIQSVANFYDSAWSWAYAGHPYWSKRKTEIAENWARTYRQGEKRDLATEIFDLGLDSLTDEHSQRILTTWKCLNDAEIVYLRDSISMDSFYNMLTCMPSFNEVPIDSIPIQYDTLSYCHWDSAVLMKPDGAKYNAGSRPHYILNLGDSSIMTNNIDNLYYIKEGSYKLIYTPTLLTEYSIKQILVKKNIPQLDSIDSTMNYCNWSSTEIETNGYVTYSINEIYHSVQMLGDTPHLVTTDSAGIYNLTAGDYKITVCDPKNCSTKITNLTISSNTPDTSKIDSTMIIYDWSGVGISTKNFVTYEKEDIVPYLLYRIGDSINLLPDSVYRCNLTEGNYKVICYDTNSCNIRITNLNVEVDTPDIDYSDTTISFCQWDDSTKVYYNFFYSDTLPHIVYMLTPYTDTFEGYDFKAGEYVIKYYDTFFGTTYINNLTVIADSIEIDTQYRSLTYCDWADTNIVRYSCVSYYDTLPFTIESTDTLIDSVSAECLSVGNYIVTSYNINNCTKTLTYLTVGIDTITSVDGGDTTVYFCNYDSSQIVTSNKAYYIPSANYPYRIVQNTPISDTILGNRLPLGTYTTTVFDLANCQRIIKDVTVSATSPEIEYRDTTIYFCNVTGSDTSSTWFLPADSLPYTMIMTSPYADSTLSDFLIEGNYIIRHYDTLNCKIIQTSLTIADSTEVNKDSTISYCDWTGSGIDAQNCVVFNLPSHLPLSIIMTSPVIDTLVSNKLLEGTYVITAYDLALCKRSVVNLTVNATSPSIEYLDTSLSYCNFSEWSSKHYIPTDSLPYTFIMTSPVADSSLSERLTAGSYVLRHYDTMNCRVIETSITVTALGYDTTYLTDTLPYSCVNDSSMMFVKPCDLGAIRDKFNNLLEPIDSVYYLNPHYGYYTSYCVDTANCIVNKTILSFIDIVQAPPGPTDQTYGTFDRTEDSCCFVNIEMLACTGKVLALNDEIKIFNNSGVFICDATIGAYGLSETLGFRFCPPNWNTDSSYINNWYSIVMRKDTCDFCRFDFMCDSLVEFFAPFQDNSEKNNETGQSPSFNNNSLKSGTSISKVDNNEGGVARIVIFPNPTNKDVNVRINNIPYNNIKINIYDNTGRHVFASDYPVNKDINAKINMSDFDSGVYTIHVPALNYYYKLILIK